MSHFCVAVIHEQDQDIAEMLDPYWEGMEMEPYIKYTREQAIQLVRSWKGHENMSDDEAYKYIASDYEIDDNGNLLTTYNPQSKWDWYEIGGRWHDFLPLKNGNHANSARLCDIDFSPSKEDYEKAIRFWDVYVDGAPCDEEEAKTHWSLYNADYYRDTYGTREVYAEAMSNFATFAVVTPDGDWHEKAQMGWFGLSDATARDELEWPRHYFDRFIKGNDPDMFMTIVDCHI